MSDKSEISKIHLVPEWYRAKIERQDFLTPGAQGELFPIRRQRMVIFVHFPEVTEQEFREIVEFAEPSHIIELRGSPRFDIGGLDRRSAFQAFERKNVIYWDLTSSSMDKGDSDSVLSNLARFFHLTHLAFERPIVFLTSPPEAARGIPQRVLEICAQFGLKPDSVYEVPRFVSASGQPRSRPPRRLD